MTQKNPKKISRGGGAGILRHCGGAQDVLAHIRKKLESENWDAELEITGCNGMCHREPLVEVRGPEGSVLYGDMTPKKVDQVFENHLKNQTPVERFRLREHEADSPAAAFLAKQRRIVLRNCGVIDPEDIGAYREAGGWKALPLALEKGPEWVLAEMKVSGLRGRGGAGFPTGLKWEFARKAPGDRKVVVCNADEGDPGAFMDRSVLESDPHSVLEGMAVAAMTIGASSGYIYCRAEYPLAVMRLYIAIAQSREAGFWAKIFWAAGFPSTSRSRRRRRFRVRRGDGAFGLHRGQRGMPRPRPPFRRKRDCGDFQPTSTTWKRTPTCLDSPQRRRGVCFSGHREEPRHQVFALAGKSAAAPGRSAHGHHHPRNRGRRGRRLVYGARNQGCAMGGPRAAAFLRNFSTRASTTTK
jgi:NADH-quinone oxidoreductase subunit F